MKRINNLYQDIYKLDNMMYCFNEVCKNTRNKNKVNRYKEFKLINIYNVYNVYNKLKNKTYKVGKFNIFYIYEPKKRRIVSQDMEDKLVNHLVSRYILYPAIIPCLIDSNCASRPNKGTSYALKLYYKYRKILYNKYKDNYYLLKCDIKGYFDNINIDILKNKIKRRINKYYL